MRQLPFLLTVQIAAGVVAAMLTFGACSDESTSSGSQPKIYSGITNGSVIASDIMESGTYRMDAVTCADGFSFRSDTPAQNYYADLNKRLSVAHPEFHFDIGAATCSAGSCPFQRENRQIFMRFHDIKSMERRDYSSSIEGFSCSIEHQVSIDFPDIQSVRLLQANASYFQGDCSGVDQGRSLIFNWDWVADQVIDVVKDSQNRILIALLNDNEACQSATANGPALVRLVKIDD